MSLWDWFWRPFAEIAAGLVIFAVLAIAIALWAFFDDWRRGRK